MCRRLVCLLRSGCVSQLGSRLCWNVPVEGTGKEVNRLISGRLRKRPRHPQRKSQEPIELVYVAQSPEFALTDGCRSPGPSSVQFQTHRFEDLKKNKSKTRRKKN